MDTERVDYQQQLVEDVNGASLYYEERGSGAPLVLIHGGLASSAMWEPLLPDLVEDFRVITPDSRGHGRSTNPSGKLSYAQIADDVATLIASLGLVRPVVGGYLVCIWGFTSGVTWAFFGLSPGGLAGHLP